MNILIVLLGILSSNFFFICAAVLGYQYEGVENSFIYILYCILVGGANIVLVLKYIIEKNKNISFNELFLLIIFPMIVSTLFLITEFNSSVENYQAKRFYLFFLLFTIPAVYAAIYVNITGISKNLIKWFELIMIFISLSLFSSIYIPFFQGIRFESFGGANYQTVSYLAAFAFGLNLYFLFVEENNDRFKFTQKKLYVFICILLLFFQFGAIFLSGGRGGIILAFIYISYISLVVWKRKKIEKVLRLIITCTFSTLILIFLAPYLFKNSLFSNGLYRVFQFVSNDFTINWEGTSGRNEVYIHAIRLINESPIWGYGLYGYLDYSTNPHNIFLEILLNGGILFFTFCGASVLYLTVKLDLMIRQDVRNRFLVILLIYPLIVLMFSGSYLISAQLWFVIAIVFTYKSRNFKKIKIN